MKKILKGMLINYFTIYFVFQGFSASAFELQSQDSSSDDIELSRHKDKYYLLLTQLQNADEQTTLKVMDNIRLNLDMDTLPKKQESLKLKYKTSNPLILARTVTRCRTTLTGEVECWEEYRPDRG
jgi:hypothetical protein